MHKNGLKYLLLTAFLTVMASCSVYKYVPEGEYLYDGADVAVEGDQVQGASFYKGLSRQTPNKRWLGLFRIPLRIYSMSGQHSTDQGRNSIFRNIGEEPVIMDSLLCVATRDDMIKSLVNSGYLDADASFRIIHETKPKAKVRYTLIPGQAYVVDRVWNEIADSAVRAVWASGSEQSLVKPGMKLDATVLDAERTRIVELMQQRGYYHFNKECISFVADTVYGSPRTGLTMYIEPYQTTDDGKKVPYPVYTVDSISYVFSESSNFSDAMLKNYMRRDYDGFSVYWQDDGSGQPKLKPRILESHSFLRQGRPYSSTAQSRTYSSLARLGLLKYTNIRFEDIPGKDALDCKVFLVSNPRRSFSFEVEGTNTAGDLGAAASLSAVDRNLFGGAEQLTVKLRGAYEAITNLPGYSGHSYMEYGVETNLDFPELLVPFLSQDFQRRSQATSQLGVKLNAQRRPEFNKQVFSTSWSYLWSQRRHTYRWDVIDVNYLFVPWISSQFQHEYLDPISNRNSILKYNYENLLISRTGFTWYFSNAVAGQVQTGPQVSMRMNLESSGNLFYGLSKAFGAQQNEDGQYRVLDIAFAQYFKHDFSITAKWKIDSWSDLLLHTEYGIAVPYGNSSSLPFEKRYFAGGANNVRGWAVRELGPGSYMGEADAVNYITQSGDIKLYTSLEMRSHLFWKLNAAFFIDAGNIWTIRDYEEQPGGVFRFDTFYNQIALSYGLGLRLDLNFLILRLDCGMKAINPGYSSGIDRYPVLSHDLSRDLAVHFAVGYPF